MGRSVTSIIFFCPSIQKMCFFSKPIVLKYAQFRYVTHYLGKDNIDSMHALSSMVATSYMELLKVKLIKIKILFPQLY